ncbi:ParH-like protein [Streptomyces tateyamensis]|uniref:ParH-like protein n=1 Tax=Streptomyces tateyamensis TaxID=565073 RepID=A0A2V4MYG5_9ACTN|nr:ParH-like protein [Streptomyces tateyamensis]
MWERCRTVADSLQLPVPFDAARFIAALAERRGRPIDLVPVTGRPQLPCGLLVTTDTADCILYAADTTELHQQHILLHEAAHLICGHPESAPAAASAARTLLPNLSGALVARVLGRTVYREPQEREAELLASMILHRAQQSVGPAAPQGNWVDAVFGRAEDSGTGPHGG